MSGGASGGTSIAARTIYDAMHMGVCEVVKKRPCMQGENEANEDFWMARNHRGT